MKFLWRRQHQINNQHEREIKAVEDEQKGIKDRVRRLERIAGIKDQNELMERRIGK